MRKNLRSYIINIIAVVVLFFILWGLMLAGIIDSYYSGILVTVGINIILAASLNLSTGFLGQLVLGHAGFMSVGAYAAALFTMNMPEGIPLMVRFLISLLVGGLVAAIFGIAIGIPALRLRGDYLAIITLGFAEIIRVVILNLGFTGGGQGLKNIPTPTDDTASYFAIVFWIMVLVLFVLYSFIRSRQGRAIKSIRDDEIAAESCGINTTYYKILGFTVSAFFAGIAGGLYAHYITILDPSNFGFMRSIEILVMVVLGGMGSFTGSILAATVLTALPEALRAFSDYRMLIYSLLLIVMMIFKPSGLLGTYEFSLTRLLDKLMKRVPKAKSKSKEG
ncbi:branched-chain amino acid ABC transporter permease [Acetanaerobacterium elongatum]|uniref:Amino acid/amide ABC transporter membrane protein 2, HAAT family n=1 Tax=Acetanaerobacterium elongatum TaxID=258515 RepID=A0A1H0FGD9_9FIRM|nr:branched-chain amino acid ABC transporter permease [Acetanaerobacterium elongatum]SDN93499.1 amino acid/amide ABC transporter membrane protein 2, HAAT family [Acetanaerobacterium elongatum]